MSKNAYSKLEAAKKLKAAGFEPQEIRDILAAKGGPKGADIEAGMIYYLPAKHAASGEAELFVTHRKAAWGRETFFNGAFCLTAMARSPEFEAVEAAKVVGASNIRSAEIGEPVLSIDEANQILMAEIERRIAAQDMGE